MPRTLIETRDLTRDYRVGPSEVRALDRVDLSVVIVGVSGSGKSTLLHLLGGLDTASSGQILVEGRDQAAYTEDERTDYRRKSVGFVFQGFHLIPSLTAEANVSLALTFQGTYGDERRIRAREALYRVGLESRRDHRDVEQARTMFLIIDSLLFSVGFVALVVAGLGIVNTLLMTVLERFSRNRRLQGIGCILWRRSSDVSRRGWGRRCGRWDRRDRARAHRFVGAAGGPRRGCPTPRFERGDREISLSGLAVLGSMTFSIAVSIMSALYPASRAAKTEPIKALRSQ